MDFTKISIKRPVAIIVAMFAVLILGVVSIKSMQMALIPEMEIPVALVMTQYSGAGPEEVETLVTKTIEGAVSNVENTDSISSISSEGISIVIAEFNYGTDMNDAVNSIRDKLGMVDMMLPEDAD